MKPEFDVGKSKITPALARIVAHICADGYLGISQTKRSARELLAHPRKNMYRFRYNVRYVNSEEALMRQFAEDAKSALGRKAVRSRWNEYEVTGKWVYECIKTLGAGKSHEWFISECIRKGTRKVKIQWLKAFFDDEAHVSTTHKRIVLNIVNLIGLKQIQVLLSELGIDSRIGGPYRCREFYSYHLKIYRPAIYRYSKIIGFNHPKKQTSLRMIMKKMRGAKAPLCQWGRGEFPEGASERPPFEPRFHGIFLPERDIPNGFVIAFRLGAPGNWSHVF